MMSSAFHLKIDGKSKRTILASTHMAPYEALYGRPCQSAICWTGVGERSITCPDLIRDNSEKVDLIEELRR